MEKIRYAPLIEELKTHSALYNQWNNNSEMKYGKLPVQTILNWMVEVVEPIVKSAIELNSSPEKTHEVVKVLYLQSLNLIGNGLAIRYKDEYKMAWLLMTKIPNLLLKFPNKIILLLNDVVLNLNTYAFEKTKDWCSLMETTSAEIKTIEDFKIVGRIYAWKCGLAHLRTRLKTDFESLSENLQTTIANHLTFDKNSSKFFENPWANNSMTFEGIQGGFEGTTGCFQHPPTLAIIDECIFVTDSKSTFALFVDQFGKVLMPAYTVDPHTVLSNSISYNSIKKWIGNDNSKIESENISSAVIRNNTLVFTLQNSYFLYLYSLKNA